MNRKLLAGLATVGLLAGGGSAVAAVAPAAVASTATVASTASKMPDCGPLAPLVAKGTITHAQAIDIRNALISYVHSHWRSTLEIVLGQQVRKHTITRSQATAVVNAITQWVHKYQDKAPSHHGPCHYGHGGNMKGTSGDQ